MVYETHGNPKDCSCGLLGTPIKAISESYGKQGLERVARAWEQWIGGHKKVKKLTTLLSTKLENFQKALREFLYGMTVHEVDLELKKEKAAFNRIFMLIVFGDLVGLPLLPNYYSMRLLPYIIPSIERWKRGLLKEKDLTDFASVDI